MNHCFSCNSESKCYSEGKCWRDEVVIEQVPKEEAVAPPLGSDAIQKQALETVAKRARWFLAVYDEFWPEYPYAISKNLQSLVEAVDALGEPRSFRDLLLDIEARLSGVKTEPAHSPTEDALIDTLDCVLSALYQLVAKLPAMERSI